ncbi:sigma-70 family RNA polymerase sigma factor [Phytoactinopolyspora sp. XMNu-373]|uniref:Sigma-70 family RNA polymerase sigma factor n=1 Tax=Phytoactinopolyspora mesophila TaxID=2650750 RepID=A0A7K3LZ51_9ACTN|nr:sigma-70 family RNA polymerase sigma factor [Phytoactinopolyspora mesophila]
MSDLVHEAKAGDQRAWREIVDRHASLVWSVVRSHRLTDPDAGDVFQTTWLRLVESLGRLNKPEQLSAWLVTTARRECLRHIKRRDREFPDPEAVDVSADADNAAAMLLGVSENTITAPDTAILRRERDGEILAAYRKLPERCQALLRLYLAEPPLSYNEIADILGLPVGSVGPNRGRCLAHLRKLLAGNHQAAEAEGDA